MQNKEQTPQSVDEYIGTFPKEIQALLEQLRSTIRKAAPDAIEKISYNMPAYSQNGILVYFAGYKNHIGFYPTPSGISTFKQDLNKYKSSKGAVQFPVDEKLPLKLIEKIVKFRVAENLRKEKK